jgi:hypothetical protein
MTHDGCERLHVRWPPAVMSSSSCQRLPDFGSEAESEEESRQRQSQRRPQTDDTEIDGCSRQMNDPERGQELVLIFGYGSHDDLLSTFRCASAVGRPREAKSERIFDRLVGQIARLHH